ncbi:WD40 repeat domain-containing protein [Crocosphaera sp.]|uniref:WD40 repeat domain-containing protein n=1 Tax=Crocosphaera sp. TaxID=2729996 RepID=UPI003F2807AE|nr:WD40 repeat domain-containing protein [Crocosphaera sp.]
MKHQDKHKQRATSLGLMLGILVLLGQGWLFSSSAQLIRQQREALSEQKINSVNLGVRLKHRLEGHTTPIRSLAFSPNGETVISGGGTNEPFLKFWSIRHGDEVDTLRSQSSAILTLAVSPNGKTLITSGEDADVHFWVWPDKGSKVTFFDHYSYVLDLVVTPDSQLLITGALDGIRVWTLEPPHFLYQLEDFGTPAHALAMHPNGFLVASADDKGKVRFWNLRDKTIVSEFEAHSQPISGLAITPDQKTLITASHDSTIKIWDLATGNLLDSWKAHKGKVQSISLSPNGQVLASASIDGVKLWNVETGRLLRHLQDHTDWVNVVAFSPDGQYLASGGFDKVVNLWEISPGFYQSLSLPRFSR